MKITKISGHPDDLKFVAVYIINQFGTTTVDSGYVPDYEDGDELPFRVFSFMFDDYEVSAEKFDKIIANLHKICSCNPMEGIVVYVDIDGVKKTVRVRDGIDYRYSNDYAEIKKMIQME